VCPDPNCNEAKMLDPDFMNPDLKHSYRYVLSCGSWGKDEESKYRYLYDFSGSGFNESGSDPVSVSGSEL